MSWQDDPIATSDWQNDPVVSGSATATLAPPDPMTMSAVPLPSTPPAPQYDFGNPPAAPEAQGLSRPTLGNIDMTAGKGMTPNFQKFARLSTYQMPPDLSPDDQGAVKLGIDDALARLSHTMQTENMVNTTLPDPTQGYDPDQHADYIRQANQKYMAAKWMEGRRKAVQQWIDNLPTIRANVLEKDQIDDRARQHQYMQANPLPKDLLDTEPDQQVRQQFLEQIAAKTASQPQAYPVGEEFSRGLARVGAGVESTGAGLLRQARDRILTPLHAITGSYSAPVTAAAGAAGSAARSLSDQAATVQENSQSNPASVAGSAVAWGTDTAGNLAPILAGSAVAGPFGAALVAGLDAMGKTTDQTYRTLKSQGMDDAAAQQTANTEGLVSGAANGALMLLMPGSEEGKETVLGILKKTAKDIVLGKPAAIGAATSLINDTVAYYGHGQKFDQGTVDRALRSALDFSILHAGFGGMEAAKKLVAGGEFPPAPSPAPEPTEPPAMIERQSPPAKPRPRGEIRVQWTDEAGNPVEGTVQGKAQGMVAVRTDDGTLHQVPQDSLTLLTGNPALSPTQGVPAAIRQTGSEVDLNDAEHAGKAEAEPPVQQAQVDARLAQREAGAEQPEPQRQPLGDVPQPIPTESQLKGMPNPKLKQVAQQWGVTFDARGTTIPRILDAIDEWRMRQEPTEALDERVKSLGQMPGSPTENIQTLLSHQAAGSPEVVDPLAKMSNKELWDKVRELGLRAGTREQNIETLRNALAEQESPGEQSTAAQGPPQAPEQRLPAPQTPSAPPPAAEPEQPPTPERSVPNENQTEGRPSAQVLNAAPSENRPGAETPNAPGVRLPDKKLASGEIATTSSGRNTTPFHHLDFGTDRKTNNTVAKVDAWLRQNAIDEATARGDDFNVRQFSATDPKRLTASDKDSMHEYLFGEQPPVVRSILKPMRPRGEGVAPHAESNAPGDVGTTAPTKTEGRDFGSPNAPNRDELGKHFAEQFAKGKSYPSINEARREVAELTGGEIKPGTPAAKAVDEAVKIGVTRHAREIANSGGQPREVFDSLVDLYNRQPNLGVRTSTSVAQQAYSTPAPLAYLAQVMAGVKDANAVYEPTAGNGMLLTAADPSRTIANELNPDRANALKSQGFKVTTLDAADNAPGRKFDAIVMNPPFGAARDEAGRKSWTINGVSTNELDHAIALRALGQLEPQGKSVLILGAKGMEAKEDIDKRAAYTNKNLKFYKHLYDNYNVVDHFTIGGDLYSRQGAKFPVDVIVIDGRGKSERPYPWKPDGLVRTYDDWNQLADHALALSERTSPRVESAGSGEHVGSGNPAPAEGQEPDAGSVSGPPRGPNPVDDRSGRGSGAGVSAPEPESAGPKRRERDRPEPPGNGPSDRGSVGRPVEAVGGTERGEVAGGGGTPEPRDAGDQGNGPGGVAGLPDSKRPRLNSDETTEFQAEYRPASDVGSVGALVPRNMATPISEALEDVKATRGDLTRFVADELGFSHQEMGKKFSAEQNDALALAIHAHKNGDGFIIGDQTGVGKGRVGAGMIEYARQNDMVPVFVTQQPALFGDMIRDLMDIGVSTKERPFEPLATNELTGDDKIPLPDGRILKTGSKGQENVVTEAIRNYLETGKLEAGGKEYHAIFTTYSQLQSVKGEKTWRQNVLNDLAHRAFLILDESHEAGGTKEERRSKKQEEEAPKRSEVVRQLVQKAAGVMYSSATYAKRPDVMDLYSRTDMAKAVDGDVSKLADAIKQGGVPLQQVTANMLAQVGQYIRRERTFKGVDFKPHVVPVDLKLADQLSESFRAVRDFDKEKESAIKKVRDAQVGEGGGMGVDTSTGKAGVSSTNFSSIMWNVVDQMLLALKAEKVAQEAIESVKRGERPVVVVDNTMEAVLDRFIEAENIKHGDPVPHSFKDLVQRYLERSREVVVKTADNEFSRHYLTDSELGPAGLEAYNSAKKIINKLEVGDLPISPIDYIMKKLSDAGLKFGEITGRDQRLEYQDDGPPLLAVRSPAEIGTQGKINTVKAYNDGEIHGVLMNRSASTGLSLHSSPKFKNTDRRHMIIAQAAKNIDTFMQMLGRVHRTGQVVPPKYTLVMSDAPAENRPASVLTKKLASLNASVTASSKGAVGFDAPDLMNEVGNQVIGEYLEDNPDLAKTLDLEWKKPDSEGKYPDDLAAKATGRAALMPVKDQHQFWKDVTEAFDHRIKELNAINDNPLVAQTMDLDAKTEKEMPLFEGDPSGNSPFSGPAMLNEMDVKRQGKPYTSDQVQEKVKESLGGDFSRSAIDSWKQTRIDGLHQAFEKYASGIENNDRMYEARKQFNKVRDFIDEFHPATGVEVTTPNGETFKGYITDVFQRGKPKNPAASSTWNLRVAVADAARELTIPMSRIGDSSWNYKVEKAGVSPSEFDNAQSRSREKRYMATGNLLAAFAQLEDGRIVNYTDSEGKQRQGIMMPKKFTPQEYLDKGMVSFSNPDHVLKFLEAGNAVRSTNDEQLRISRSPNGGLVVEAPKSKARGAKYFLNEPIMKSAGEEFATVGSKMRMFVSPEKAKKVVKTIMDQFQLGAFESKDEARKITGQQSIEDKLKGMQSPKKPPVKPEDFGTDPMVGGPGFQPPAVSESAYKGKLEGEESTSKSGSILGSAKEQTKAMALHLKDSAQRFSGKMFPTLTRLARKSGETAARYISSTAYAKQAAPVIAEEIIGRPEPAESAFKRWRQPRIDPEMDKKVGAVLAEDNLRGISAKAAEKYDQAKEQIREAITQGKSADEIKPLQEAERRAFYEAQQVHTLIGGDGSPFKTEAEYQDALKDPKVQDVIERYKDWWKGEPEANYKVTQGIAPDEELEGRGEQTGARVNLKAVLPDQEKPATTVITSPSGNLRNPKLKRSPFAKKAKGTAPAYDISLSAMIENTLGRGTEIANQHRFYRQLVRDGIAEIGEPQDHPKIGGKASIGIPIKDQVLVTKNGLIPKNQTLWVRADAYPEVRRALNVDSKLVSKTLESASGVANKAALLSLGEATAHIANQLSTVVRTPGLSVVDVLKKGVQLATGDLEARRQLINLAKIGASPDKADLTSGKFSKFNPLSYTSKLIQYTDHVARLSVDDAFTKLARKGLVENTETNRRDFVNQLGQYNKRGQHALIELSRNLGTGPFATAGTNFYSLGLKNMVLSPGVKATSWPAAIKLRAAMLGRFGAAVGLVALYNYMKWHRADGGNNVPYGAIRLDDDKEGKVRYFDVLGLMGITRGLRASGVRAVIEGKREGSTNGEIGDRAIKDAANELLSPFEGPLVNTATTALAGHNAHGFQKAERAEQGQSQTAQNIKAAAKGFNPIVDLATGGKNNQLGKFAPKTGSRPEETRAEMLARKMIAEKAGREQLTPSEKARKDERKQLVAQIQSSPAKGPDLIRQAVKDGKLPLSEAKEVFLDSKRSDIERSVLRLDADQSMQVWRMGEQEGWKSPDERLSVRKIILGHILHSKTLTVDQRKSYLKELNAGAKP